MFSPTLTIESTSAPSTPVLEEPSPDYISSGIAACGSQWSLVERGSLSEDILTEKAERRPVDSVSKRKASLRKLTPTLDFKLPHSLQLFRSPTPVPPAQEETYFYEDPFDRRSESFFVGSLDTTSTRPSNDALSNFAIYNEPSSSPECARTAHRTLLASSRPKIKHCRTRPLTSTPILKPRSRLPSSEHALCSEVITPINPSVPTRRFQLSSTPIPSQMVISTGYKGVRTPVTLRPLLLPKRVAVREAFEAETARCFPLRPLILPVVLAKRSQAVSKTDDEKIRHSGQLTLKRVQQLQKLVLLMETTGVVVYSSPATRTENTCELFCSSSRIVQSAYSQTSRIQI